MAPGESLTAALKRVVQLSSAQRSETIHRGWAAARELNDTTIRQWLDILHTVSGK